MGLTVVKKEQVCKLLSDIAEEVNKELGGRFVVAGPDDNLSDIPYYVPTRSTLLNIVMGDGRGVPATRIVEIFGENQHGKSTVAQEIIIAFQRAGGLSVLIDSESKWDRKRAHRAGHEDYLHLHFDVDSAELGFAAIYKAVGHWTARARAMEEALGKKKGKKMSPSERKGIKEMVRYIAEAPICVAWDTIAASQIEAERPDEAGSSAKETKAGKKSRYADGMAYKPRLIREELRKLVKWIGLHNVTLVFTNHITTSFDQFGPGFDVPGGTGIPYWASGRFLVRKVGRIVNADGVRIGIRCQVKTWKGSYETAREGRAVTLSILDEIGVCPPLENFVYLYENTQKGRRPVVNQTGGWYYIYGLQKTLERIALGCPLRQMGGDPEWWYLSLRYNDLLDLVAKYPLLGGYLAEQVLVHWYGVT